MRTALSASDNHGLGDNCLSQRKSDFRETSYLRLSKKGRPFGAIQKKIGRTVGIRVRMAANGHTKGVSTALDGRVLIVE